MELSKSKTLGEMDILIETLLFLNDKKTLNGIYNGLKDAREGRYISEDELFEDLKRFDIAE